MRTPPTVSREEAHAATQRARLFRLVLASAVSELGDWFTYIAMTVLAATAGEGALALAGVVLSQTVPRAALAPFAGALIDRFDRRAIAVVALSLRGALVFAMALAAHARALTPLLLLHVLRMALGAVTDGATRAAMPRWFDEATLVRANRTLAALWSLWLALGLLAGGALTALVSPTAALVVDACSFVLAAAVLATLPAVPPSLREKNQESTPSLWGELRASGAAEPLLWRVALSRAPLALAAGAGFVALGLRAARAETTTGATLALTSVLLLRALGNAVGAWWASGLARRDPARFARTAVVAFAAGLAGVACFSRPLPSAAVGVAAVCWGAGLGAQWSSVSLALQRASPDAVLGRWISLDLFVFTLAQGSGGLLVAALTEAGHGPLALPTALALSITLALSWWRGTR